MNKFFLSIREKLQKLNTKKVLIFASIATSIGGLCLIIAIISINVVKKEPEIQQISYELEYPIELPKEPGYEAEYKLSREPQKSWSREEVTEHFTIPEGENLERLSSANEKIIIDILEAAP